MIDLWLDLPLWVQIVTGAIAYIAVGVVVVRVLLAAINERQCSPTNAGLMFIYWPLVAGLGAAFCVLWAIGWLCGAREK